MEEDLMVGRSRSFGLVALSALFAACSGVPADVDEPGAPGTHADAIPVEEPQVHEMWFVELELPPTARGGDLLKLNAEKARFRQNIATARIAARERYTFD